MKIALIADPFIPVPPLNYGGIERMIDFLITGLKKRGHETILLAHPDSVVPTKLVAFGDQQSPLKHFHNILKVNSLRTFNPDVIHSFGRLAYLLPFLFQNIPKIMSYQREPTLTQIGKAMNLARKNSLYFTGCSDYISNQIKPIAPSYTVYNGVEIDKYTFSTEVPNDAPLVFLGRIEPIKGTHNAIEVAQKTGKSLVIAGNIPPEYQSYFDQQVRPHLNEQISYIGTVNDQQKDVLLRNALAFLMPIEWNEPFGIVMAEAMACGTPVIGFNRGSVPEVVEHGISGFKCHTVAEMIEFVQQIDQIDRKKVRDEAERRFSSDVIVENYLEIYRQAIKISSGN